MQEELDKLIPDLDYLKSLSSNFAAEIAQAAEDKPSSLSFLKYPVELDAPGVKQSIQVMVIGGSTFETAIVTPKGMELVIKDKYRKNLPILSTKNIFLDFIISNLAPGINHLSINLAYPLRLIRDSNGMHQELISGRKENSMTGLYNLNLNQTISDYILQKLGRKIEVVLANDAICLLLAGLTQGLEAQSLVAAISGTGCNLSLVAGTDAANLEMADFSKFDPGVAVMEIDKTTVDPGHSLLEKEISGAYLYKHYNYWIKQFGLRVPQAQTTLELSLLAHSGLSDTMLEISPEIAFRAEALARTLLERSAALFAAALTGVYQYRQQQTLNVIADGSLFWEGYHYQSNVVDYMARLGIKLGSVNMLRLRQRSLLGAAKLLI